MYLLLVKNIQYTVSSKFKPREKIQFLIEDRLHFGDPLRNEMSRRKFLTHQIY